MSVGHKHKGRELSHQELNEALGDPDIEKYLERDFKIDTSYDMPYLAGYNVAGTVRYVDRHFYAPGQPVGTIIIDGKPTNVLPFLVGDPDATDPIERGGHEGVEKACEEDLGDDYDHAHEVATGAERRLVTKAGINWTQYQRALEPFIKADEHETLERMPEDFDMAPILSKPVNKALVASVRKAMAGGEEPDQGKEDKEDVDYTKGTKAHHCGNCEHFEVYGSNLCERVKGYIDSRMWCIRWSDGYEQYDTEKREYVTQDQKYDEHYDEEGETDNY